MSAAPDEDDWDDLLPDDLAPAPKKGAVPVRRTKKQVEAALRQAERDKVHADNQRLAQIINLTIAGYSLGAIGAQIGMTGDEVDRLLAQDTQRYVRTQPALRTYVRNYVSGRYSELLEAVWTQATDQTHGEKLENQDRALRILNNMAKLHGAEAPTQTEIKVEAAPEAVERLVSALSAQQGLGYDMDIFDVDVIEEADVHEAVEQTHAALEVSRNQVEASDDDDEL